MKFKKTIAALGVAGVLLGSTAVFSEPGSESDPVVSLSYLNIKLEELRDYIDEKLDDRTEAPSSGDALVVVELQRGQRLIGYAGTEIILRGGQATAITSLQGGLTDVTAGDDIREGEQIPTNHMLVIARDDGRGIYATSENKVYLMVRGRYSVEY